MKKFILAASLMLLSMSSFAAKVVMTSANFVYTETSEWNDKISISFEKCMANNLYTFKEVKLNGTTVNLTGSDNIGPFSVQGGVWLGGNHTNGSNVNSAKTISYTVEIDGEVKRRGTFDNVKVVHVNVVNELYYYPDMVKFADEIVDYYISGNSIDVRCHHEFTYPTPLNVARYYGAQSMFPATELLLPGTDGNQWISLPPSKYEIDVMKADFPTFSTYIEKNANGYQVVYKFDEGLGDGSCISANGEVYLFRNYGGATGKSYHVMMWDHIVKNGDKTDWRALYSWFSQPLEDTFREESRAESGEKTFAYGAYINGEPQVMKLNADGTMDIATSGINDIVVDSDEAGEPVEYYNLQGVKVSNPSAGMYIVRDTAGHSSKLYVK